jgi:hypothetical protein
VISIDKYYLIMIDNRQSYILISHPIVLIMEAKPATPQHNHEHHHHEGGCCDGPQPVVQRVGFMLYLHRFALWSRMLFLRLIRGVFDGIVYTPLIELVYLAWGYLFKKRA